MMVRYDSVGQSNLPNAQTIYGKEVATLLVNGVENYDSVLAHGLVSTNDRQVEEMLLLRGTEATEGASLVVGDIDLG